ncbi:Hsp20/alpha crystallin family protein [Massilia glaciei]|uniref:Hsp20/alpha crystallin family protein n=1 Tax=Massilia glaciei TaxID=1524097 RepID=A0A2U2HHK4_9BURK|nr:Hsp20/alpha crystallin family protein [Massilia glaciei]PWF45382.1 Hsp20/alpha crystallin family protein [Massilia glaciei]
MANIRRYDPFNDIARQDPFRGMDEIFREMAGVPAWRGSESGPRLRVDVTESDQSYTVIADVPGVNKDDIKVAVEGSQVTISAQVLEDNNVNSTGVLRNERFYGQLYRTITLPQEVDDDAAEAKYENGVLRLTLPKKQGTGAKQLTVQ